MHEAETGYAEDREFHRQHLALLSAAIIAGRMVHSADSAVLLNSTEDAHKKGVSIFGTGEHLRSAAPSGAADMSHVAESYTGSATSRFQTGDNRATVVIGPKHDKSATRVTRVPDGVNMIRDQHKTAERLCNDPL